MLSRVAQAAAVLLGVAVLVFAILQLVPGDPVRIALGTRYTEETAAALRARSGLDQPVLVQFWTWFTGALTGDLGVSFRSGDPVTALIVERLPATLSLAGMSILVALLIAVPLGTVSALRPRTTVDGVATVFSQAGISIPDFWMGILLIVFVAPLLALPTGGYVPLTEDPAGWLRAVILPAVTVGVTSGSILTRFVRSSLIEAADAEHVRTARSKGLTRPTVLGWHVMRNALLPFVTVVGVQLAYLLSGVVVVEIVFSYPGLGELALQAVQSRDFPLLQGAVLLFAVVFLVINLLVDLSYAALDPRVGTR
ncbi:ABC transporter permease [Aquipuribacter nitratireducens]|uniref:ABC transporter permease n=1 Tax=Aquipuribacter nitratireducens TaxID=650104 RepID=A0ABW0GPA9_9MICO